MPEHQQEQAPVAGFIPATLRGGNQLLNFGRNKVFSVAHRFVSCWGVLTGRKPASILKVIFKH
jgi:hypothetical protein